MKEPVEFRKVRDFGDVISDTVLFIKQNIKPLLKAYLFLCGFFVLASMINSVLMQVQVGNLVKSANAVDYSRGTRSLYMFSNFTLNYVLMFVFIILNYTAIYLTVLSYISLYVRKGNIAPTVAEVWSYFKYYFWRMLGSGILMSMFLGLSFVLCLVPGIYVFPAATIFYPILILENAGFSFSFNRAFKLLKGEWWVTFATLLVIFFIYYACAMVIQVPAVAISMAGAFMRNNSAFFGTYGVIMAIAQQFSQVFMIIPIVGAAVIYFNLVERKESTGLMERIDSLGQNNAKDDHPFVQEEY
ncbi:hypothetical protein [Pedobacter sp. ASV12]|uniref:hypothetical protein n=1 Tax=Pedobacter sp. ASV12 TaxID=2795120 RepID=UPI0018EC41BC|nr:hypothetical protein [Pedobacter sp. ASV12]